MALAGDAPTFTGIDDQVVEVGAPIHVPIDAVDSDSDSLTISVEVDDPNAVQAEVISGSRSLRLEVTGFGTMVFELFEQRAPGPALRVIELAEAGFYDGLLFHRVDEGFVLQGGDPNGDGTGGSSLGDFDDQFHPDLQHNRPGVLSFAKTNDDTNNSQFFITEASPRFLDFNHSVFGQLIEGADVQQAISEVPVDGDDRPITPVVIESATIFQDTENGLVMLRAMDADLSTNITVTVTDPEGNESAQVFSASTIGDQVNAGPYLIDPPREILVVAGETLELDFDAVDLEDDPVVFLGQYVSATLDSSASLIPETGVFELNTAPDQNGSIDLIFAVRSEAPTDHIDIQELRVVVRPRFLNQSDRYDVDRSGETTAQDALLIINALNRSNGNIALPALPADEGGPSLNELFAYNVSGDLAITAQDALLVINELARQGFDGGSEGESPARWIAPLARTEKTENSGPSLEDPTSLF